MSIVQVRGTSGSGKTWVVRQVVDRLVKWLPHFEPGRKQPLYSVSVGRPRVVVLGQYSSACGGADSIGSSPAIHALTLRVLAEERPDHVLYESLLSSEDVKWSLQLPDLRVIFLVTPVEQCVRQIKARRLEAGNADPLDETNTRRRVAVIERARLRLTAAGVECRRMRTEQAVRVVTKWVTR